jgi:hypothetical protein
MRAGGPDPARHHTTTQRPLVSPRLALALSRPSVRLFPSCRDVARGVVSLAAGADEDLLDRRRTHHRAHHHRSAQPAVHIPSVRTMDREVPGAGSRRQRRRHGRAAEDISRFSSSLLSPLTSFRSRRYGACSPTSSSSASSACRSSSKSCCCECTHTHTEQQTPAHRFDRFDISRAALHAFLRLRAASPLSHTHPKAVEMILHMNFRLVGDCQIQLSCRRSLVSRLTVRVVC